MEDVKNTQEPVTPTDSNKEAKGGEDKTNHQEIIDKAVKDRLARERDKFIKEKEEAITKALAEAERKAKMTQEELEREVKSKREAELEAREQEITLRERTIEASNLLIEKGISTDLTRFVVDLDSSKNKDNVNDFAKIFNKAVEQAVNDKLKGKTPQDYSNSNDKKPESPKRSRAF